VKAEIRFSSTTDQASVDSLVRALLRGFPWVGARLQTLQRDREGLEQALRAPRSTALGEWSWIQPVTDGEPVQVLVWFPPGYANEIDTVRTMAGLMAIELRGFTPSK